MKIEGQPEGIVEDELDAFLDSMTDKFRANPLRFSLNYTGHLYPLSEHSAILEFRKVDQPTSELDGKEIEITLREDDGEGRCIVGTIQNEEVIIEFNKFGITIADYQKLKYRIHLDESITIGGSFGDEKIAEFTIVIERTL